MYLSPSPSVNAKPAATILAWRLLALKKSLRDSRHGFPFAPGHTDTQVGESHEAVHGAVLNKGLQKSRRLQAAWVHRAICGAAGLVRAERFYTCQHDDLALFQQEASRRRRRSPS